MRRNGVQQSILALRTAHLMMTVEFFKQLPYRAYEVDEAGDVLLDVGRLELMDFVLLERFVCHASLVLS